VAIALVLSAGLVLSFLLALMPVGPALAAVVAGACAIGVCLCPHLVLIAVALAPLIGRRTGVPLGAIQLGGPEVAVVLTLGTWLLWGAGRRSLFLRVAPAGWALFAWLWVGAASLLWARSLPAGAAELGKWLEVAAVYLSAAALLEGRSPRPVMLAIAAAGAIEAIIGLVQFGLGIGPDEFRVLGRFMRAYGTFFQPNPFAGHLGLCLPFALAWALASGGPGLWERLSAGLAAAAMLAGIVASFSRGAWLAIAVALAFMGLIWKPKLTVLGIVAAIAFVLFGPPLRQSLVLQRLSGGLSELPGLNVARVVPTDENWALVERLAHWQSAWYMFASRPWLGVGLGNYEVAYPDFSLPRWQQALGHAHNVYLNVLAETGLIGLFAYIALMLSALGRAVYLGVRTHGERRAVAVAAAGSLAYLAVHSLTDSLYVQGIELLLGLILGILSQSPAEVTHSRAAGSNAA
jgi:putative inorganic carbon (HCO3(-)) transporter